MLARLQESPVSIAKQRRASRLEAAAKTKAVRAIAHISDDDADSSDAAASAPSNTGLKPSVAQRLKDLGYMRTSTAGLSVAARNRSSGNAAARMPEVHFIGEVLGATGFGAGVTCKFRFEAGKHWSLLSGADVGQTHVIYAEDDQLACWNHPVDLHYTMNSIKGWPRMTAQVWQLDAYGRLLLRGYGFTHLPSISGTTKLQIACWRPAGTTQEVRTHSHRTL